MSRMLRLLTACVVCSAAACGSEPANQAPPSGGALQIVAFSAESDALETATQSTMLHFTVQPSDAAITIDGLGDLTGRTSAQVTPGVTTDYHLTATADGITVSADILITVGPASATSIQVQPATTTPTAGEPLAVTLRVLGPEGEAAESFRGTVHVASTDPKAVLPADVTFTAGDRGVKQVAVTLKAAGPITLTATDRSVKAGVTGAAFLDVVSAPATAFQLSALPVAASAGDSLVLTITARDPFGNVATGFTGLVRVASADPTDILPPTGGFTAGVRTVVVAFTKVGNHTATVQDIAAQLPSATTTSVGIGPGAPFRIALAPANQTATAGGPELFTATLVDFFNNTATNYLGTLHFVALGDPAASVPADFTFGTAEAGSHTFSVTFKTAGSASLAVSDTARNAVSGTVTWTIGAAGAATCVAGQAPSSAVAGSVVGLIVVVRDGFNNVARGYTGTLQLTASDVRASLPPPVTFTADDAGSHPFSVALLTTGGQTVTATDVANPAIQCSVGVAVTPAAPRLVLSVPANANAGFPVTVGVTVHDLFDNAIPAYAGTVSFTSTDTGTGAAAPGPITFTGREGGIAMTTATFVTLGPQTLSATDTGSPQAAGSATAAIHGLVYTAPATGRVRLVASSASNAQVVQLDLVASERLEVSSFFGGPGSFSAGMNLPIDTTRVGAGNPLFTRGAALPVGTGTSAAVGVIGPDHVLYTAVSRKRVTGTAVATQDTDVAAGQVFYSVRLQLQSTSTVGPVFDGAQPMATYRAAVRDQFGDDFVGQSDIGVGKLEVR
ncbi:MAG TPA: hypothetical protein VHW23_45390 [Kofleriaceae bacterium]|jgi:hypothetical protein|nr:hypothetical protein [Kofleriaceae bacterium]